MARPVLLAAVLAALCASAFAASQNLEFKYDTNWFNSKNWKNGVPPQAGETILFPEAFSNFGTDRCAPNVTCTKGGVVSIRAPAGQTATISIGKLVMPLNGKIAIMSDTVISFVESTAAVPPTNQFVDRSATGFDFACADNWVISGTSSNPGFDIPCFQDKAIFPDVRFCAAFFYIPSH